MFGSRPSKRMFNERRGPGRDRSGQKAAVRLERGFAGECVVLDLSDGGARLRVENPADLPAVFEMRIGRETRWRKVQLRWRKPSEVGVAFI